MMGAMCTTRVGLVGQPFWTSRLSRLLNEHAADIVSAVPVSGLSGALDAFQCSVFLRVGYRPGASTWRGRLADVVWATGCGVRRGIRTGYYWIGTDVLNAITEWRNGTQTRWFQSESQRAAHWAGAPWLAKELRALGLPAEPVLFPGWLPSIEGVPPLPERFRVVTYIPDQRPDFYGGEQIIEVAEALPDAEFVVIGGQGAWLKVSPPRNLRFVGWISDVTRTYIESTAVVRMVRHDAIGGSVREGLALGRHVLYTYEVPHTVRIQFGNSDSLAGELHRLMCRHRAGILEPNTAGSAFARHTFNPVRLTRELASRIAELTQS